MAAPHQRSLAADRLRGEIGAGPGLLEQVDHLRQRITELSAEISSGDRDAHLSLEREMLALVDQLREAGS